MKNLSLKTFLEENGISWNDFQEAILPENQKWKYGNITTELEKHPPIRWLIVAFLWRASSLRDYTFWMHLNSKWEKLVVKAERENKVKITFK